MTGEATEVNIEQVAALKPDLIFAPGYFALQKSYQQLSAIAPTIGYQKGPAQDTWQEMTTQLATALGRPADAERVIGQVQTKLDETRAANPALQGATYTFGFVQPGAVTALRDPDDAMNSVPAALGLSLSPQILALPKGSRSGCSSPPSRSPRSTRTPSSCSTAVTRRHSGPSSRTRCTSGCRWCSAARL